MLLFQLVDVLLNCWIWGRSATAHVNRLFSFLFLCAGKSTHAGQLMGDQGRVIALDRTHAKAQQIRYCMLCPAAPTVTVMLAQTSTIFCLSRRRLASDCGIGHSRALKAAVLCLVKKPECAVCSPNLHWPPAQNSSAVLLRRVCQLHKMQSL